MKVNLPTLKAAMAYVCIRNRSVTPEVTLVKIIYGAEHSAVSKSLYSITGDSFCAYTKGSVLNTLLSLI